MYNELKVRQFDVNFGKLTIVCALGLDFISLTEISKITN